MEKSSESETNSTGSRLNVSFKFTKKVSQTAPGNKLEENSSNQKDFVTHIDENKVKRYLILSFSMFNTVYFILKYNFFHFY